MTFSQAMKELPLAGSLFLLLQGPGNITYQGVLEVHDGRTEKVNSKFEPQITGSVVFYDRNSSVGLQNSTGTPYDHRGASTYVIAVVMVYGISIVLLIGSHINRRHDKIAEDKQVGRESCYS